MSDLLSKSGDSTKFAEEAACRAGVSDGPMLPEMVVIPPGKFWMGADDDKVRKHYPDAAALGADRLSPGSFAISHYV